MKIYLCVNKVRFLVCWLVEEVRVHFSGRVTLGVKPTQPKTPRSKYHYLTRWTLFFWFCRPKFSNPISDCISKQSPKIFIFCVLKQITSGNGQNWLIVTRMSFIVFWPIFYRKIKNGDNDREWMKTWEKNYVTRANWQRS